MDQNNFLWACWFSGKNLPKPNWHYTHVHVWLNTRTTVAQWSHSSSNPKHSGLDRQIRLINFGAFGVFSVKLSAPILVHFGPCFLLYINIWPLFLPKLCLTPVSKKLGQNVVVIHYCNLSHFFWNRRYPHLKYLLGFEFGPQKN